MHRLQLAPALLLSILLPQGEVEQLRSTGGLPPHIVGQFRQPAVFQQDSQGVSYVFDRGGHRVYRHVPGDERATPIVEIGPEAGRILDAGAFDLGPDGRFIVADAPNGRERVQIFESDGTRIGGFTLPGRAARRITLGGIVLTGVGSVEFTGRAIVMSQPELGGLMTEFSLNGHPFHTFGNFRRTGHEADRDVHLALNSGLPLRDPRGGFYFVFQAGVPVFRKYTPQGNLVFERHIEGRELDPLINQLPTEWPRRAGADGRRLPVIPPTVRAAAVDPQGRLWVALTVPYVYVYDQNGDKIRTVQLRAAGTLQPVSLAFSPTGRLLVAPGCYEFALP